MRQYETIWFRLKQLSKKEAEAVGVSVSAPRSLHRRIIKAVKKEKWLDVGYKLEIEPRVAMLNSARKNSIITFTLSFSLTELDF